MVHTGGDSLWQALVHQHYRTRAANLLDLATPSLLFRALHQGDRLGTTPWECLGSLADFTVTVELWTGSNAAPLARHG